MPCTLAAKFCAHACSAKAEQLESQQQARGGIRCCRSCGIQRRSRRRGGGIRHRPCRCCRSIQRCRGIQRSCAVGGRIPCQPVVPVVLWRGVQARLEKGGRRLGPAVRRGRQPEWLQGAARSSSDAAAPFVPSGWSALAGRSARARGRQPGALSIRQRGLAPRGDGQAQGPMPPTGAGQGRNRRGAWRGSAR